MTDTKRDERRTRPGVYLLHVLGACLALVLSPRSGGAAVFDVTVTDVTTRAFAVVWVSDEPVTDATVRVFSDAEGTTDITASLALTLVSTAFPPALEQGIVKVGVTGLAAQTRVFIQTVTTSSGGTVLAPAAPPFLEVGTALRTTKATADNAPIVNDVIVHEVVPPSDTPASGILLILDAPTLALSPLTAFAGEGFPVPTAAVDLNNVFDATTEESAEVPADILLELTAWRGLRCPGLADHQAVHFRRSPAHTESPAITELETADLCFAADTVCDDTINILDVQRVLNAFNAVPATCAFNGDLDIVLDQVINILDVQSVLNRLGEEAPFTP